MNRSVIIIDPGMYTTVQDEGRRGYQRFGLPPCGAMDRAAFDTANRLLGNDPGAAMLEVTGTGPVLSFPQRTNLAIVGADMQPLIDGFPVDNNAAIEVEEEQRLSFAGLVDGYRAYIAFGGGINVPMVMGSRSTYLPGRLGGLDGRVLHAGDILPLGQTGAAAGFDLEDLPRSFHGTADIHLIPGPEADWFDCGGLNTFLTECFTVSSRSDRIGIRLEGPALSFRSDQQMVSAGLAMGTIQVPPSGFPIIMMADHPTTGGYPRIGNVVQEDLSVLAQLKPGDQLRFREARLLPEDTAAGS